MITAELHDGRILEFPDGTDPSVIQRVVKQTLGVVEQQPVTAGDVARDAWQQTKDIFGGAVRGAGSIGATLMAPQDILQDVIERQKTGRQQGVSRNQMRRADITAVTAGLGANPDSMTYGAGKLGTEIAGTTGVGQALGGVAQVIPRLGPLVEPLATAGMRGGNMALRTVGGAVTGGAAAGLVDPTQAGTGAVVGGALPGSVKLAGAAGRAIGSVVRGPAQTPETAAAIQAARDAGYVIPPTQAKPTLVNRTLEGMAGKLTTAQNASAKNQAITNAKAARAVGLPDNATLSLDALDKVRAEAGKAYENIARLGKFDAAGISVPKQLVNEATTMTPLQASRAGAGYTRPTVSTARTVDTRQLVEAWKQANHDATAYFRAYGRDANPETLAKAKAAAATAKGIDKAIEDVVKKAGMPELLTAMKEARIRIAKTYSVESAMNPVTGTVDAQKLAKQLEKGKKLSGELLDVAAFASRFKTASKPIESMGSLPQTSPLDWAMGGGLAMGTGNPLMLASMAARPAARAAILSPLVQDRLLQQGGLMGLLNDPDLLSFAARAAPVIAADR